MNHKQTKPVSGQNSYKSPNRSPTKTSPPPNEGYSKKKTIASPPPQNPQMSQMPLMNQMNQMNQMEAPSYYENENPIDYYDAKYPQGGDYGEGESIKVALRVRPMNSTELSRGDENCTRVLNETSCQVSSK